MSSFSSKDRASLCTFTFSDGRRCRTPRVAKHPRFCFYHAQKEARARAAEKLGKDLAYFFSGDYVSACDLSTALARLIPAVVRGDMKPRTAHTVAYMVQTLLQAIHLSEHEYTNAFGSDAWRKSIRNSVKGNYGYRFPPAPKSEQSAPSALRTDLRTESPQPQPQPQPGQPPAQAQQPAKPQTQPPQPAPSPHTPMAPTSAEFVQQVLARRNLSRSGRGTASLPATPYFQPATPNPPQPVPPPTTVPIPARIPPTASPTSTQTPQTSAAGTAPSDNTACDPNHAPIRRLFRHNYHPRIDGKPF